MEEQLITVSSDISLKRYNTTEFIASQITVPGKIVCVKDGYEIILFKNISEIPDNLIRKKDKINKEINNNEYHWRSSVTDSLYVFFDRLVDMSLCEREEEELRSRPIIVTGPLRCSHLTQK